MLLPQVKPQLALVTEMQLAVIALIWFLSCVNAGVTLQSLQVTEAGAAHLTGVRLLSRVDQDVGTEVCHLYKTSATCFTFVWLFS